MVEVPSRRHALECDGRGDVTAVGRERTATALPCVGAHIGRAGAAEPHVGRHWGGRGVGGDAGRRDIAVHCAGQTTRRFAAR